MSDELEGLAHAIGIDLTPAQTAALNQYLDLLQRWNATYNLTAVRERGQMRTQHIADCLAVVPLLKQRLPAGRVLDVGSGGGLPGVVIAILLPDLHVTCVDTVGKKAAFIRQVGAALSLPNLHAQQGRVEALREPPFELITSRAFASLADFTSLTQHLLTPKGCWMAMKGRRPDDEIVALPPQITTFHVEQVVVPGLDAERCLVWMRLAAAPAAN